MKEKKVLIVWSGGMDSTALLLKAIKEKIPFETVYFNITCNSGKAENEIKAREKLSALINDQYHVNWSDKIVNIRPERSSALTYPQPFLWITSLVSSVHLSEYKEIWLGYVSGDGITALKTEFINAYTNLAKIGQCNSMFEQGVPEIKIPFIMHEKRELMSYFTDNSLIKHVFFCENQEEVTCLEKNSHRKCNPCQKFEDTFKFDTFYPYKKPNELIRSLTLEKSFHSEIVVNINDYFLESDKPLFLSCLHLEQIYSQVSIIEALGTFLKFFDATKTVIGSDFEASISKFIQFISLQSYNASFRLTDVQKDSLFVSDVGLVKNTVMLEG